MEKNMERKFKKIEIIKKLSMIAMWVSTALMLIFCLIVKNNSLWLISFVLWVIFNEIINISMIEGRNLIIEEQQKLLEEILNEGEKE